jgi:hypothetical protein
MSPAPFARLAAAATFRDAVQQTPAHALDPLAVSPLHARLLRLAARRLKEGTRPPRCSYWFAGDSLPVRLDGRAI